jgi:hypothetical protein
VGGAWWGGGGGGVRFGRGGEGGGEVGVCVSVNKSTFGNIVFLLKIYHR